MPNALAYNLAALAALVPAALLPLRQKGGRDGLFWGLLALAVAGPLLWSARLLADSWNPSLSADLWVGISASLVLFAVVAALHRQAWRLTPLLVPYLLLLGVLASVFTGSSEPPVTDSGAWLDLHILVSVVTLGLLTLAAVAALGGFLQSRALKFKRPNGLTRMLPPVADSERLLERLLLVSEAVLALGLVSGMAASYLETGILLSFSHKILFSLMAFVVIGLLLIGRRVCGVRGQMAARIVLLAYLLLNLAFFGVKFVHQVLLS
jgi:ABC-type uncharacterized transport system permease subunit